MLNQIGSEKVNNEIIVALIGALAVLITGGLVPVLLQNRKEKREDKKEAQKAQKEIYETRPEFAIEDYKDYTGRTGYGIQLKCDLSVFLARIEGTEINDRVVNAQFRMEDFNQEEWCCVIYTFKNVGKTDVACVYPISMIKRSTVLYEVGLANRMAKEGTLCYSTCYDRKIRVGESFTLKVCYHKERVLLGAFSAALDLGFEDSKGHYWMQPLFAPEDKVYDSSQVTYKEYRDYLLPDSAEECFRKPWLW